MLQPRYELKHVWTDCGQRWHLTPEGPKPGVTTVLSQTKARNDQQRLQEWKERVGEDEAERIRTRATDRGSALHARIEAQLLHRPVITPKFDLGPPDPAVLERMWHQAQTVLKEIDACFAVELPVYWGACGGEENSPSNGYGGSLDCLALVHGKPMLLDWKTTRTSKPENWLQDYRCQLAAYRRAFMHTYPEFTLEHGPIEWGAIVLFTEVGAMQVVEMDASELMQAENSFGARLERFYARTRAPQALAPA